MVNRAQLDDYARQKRLQAADETLRNAAEAYLKAQEQGVFRNGIPSLERVATAFNVSRTTLTRLIHGGRTAFEYAASQLKLSSAQEEKLILYLLECADRGFPQVREHVEYLANRMLEAKHGSNYEPVGRSWVTRFMRRHRGKIAMHWSRPLDSKRGRAMDPGIVVHWFNGVKKNVIDKGIKPANMYGMDETGFQLSFQGRQRIIGRKGAKVQHKQVATDRQNTTVIVTICADGSTVRPCVILKGKNFMSKWGENNVSGASCVHVFTSHPQISFS